MVLAIAGGVVLDLCGPPWGYVERQHLANALPNQAGAVVGASSAGRMINAPANNRRYMQQLEWPEPWRSKTSVSLGAAARSSEPSL